MVAIVKQLVSKNKRRYQKDGFDLDLSYITDNIIAMGFPSQKMEGLYRNNCADVQRFLEQYHQSKYKVYNLCSERHYNAILFKNMVKKFPFNDHNPPPFRLIYEFCLDVVDYLEDYETDVKDRVVAIHCKAGKGRTGVMISCLLLYLKYFETAQESLDYYSETRTMDGKGVTIPSQQRYVRYFEQHLRESPIFVTRLKDLRSAYTKQNIQFNSITLASLPYCSKSSSSFCLIISNPLGALLTIKAKPSSTSQCVFDFDKDSLLGGDLKFAFIHIGKNRSKEKLFHFWINTCFLDSKSQCLTLSKQECDKINKDRNNKIFPQDFSVRIEYMCPNNVLEKVDESSNFSCNISDMLVVPSDKSVDDTESILKFALTGDEDLSDGE